MQGCSLGLDVSVSRRSRDVVSKRLGLVETWEGLGLDLVSDWKSNVSVSSRSRTIGSRLQANMHGFLLHCKTAPTSFFANMNVKRELTFTFAICCRLSVCRLSVCNARALFSDGWHFGNISTACCTSPIRWRPRQISRWSSQGNPSVGGVQHNRGSHI